jgi:alkanesulfonate monooxygenase SsuD/methylene tetrahydromethanopterin reductase-like flavin-dependent oxidoreductase (luciferase family)
VAATHPVEIGLFTEFEWRQGVDEAQAFDESLTLTTVAEDLGYDAVWLAELHFQKERSVLSSPLVVGAAIAGRTKRVKIGFAVQVLPLIHPLRLAEDVATLDQVSKGRLDFGVGRSGLPEHYTGFSIPYDESQERFDETLEILLKAWTEERFTYEGKYFQFHDVCAVPKPYQKPHPPLRVAATSEESYAAVGRRGLPIFLAVRTSSISDLESYVGAYHAAWREAGHPGRGEVAAILPVYVAETDRQAREETEASAMHFFHSVGTALAAGPRHVTGERLRRLTFDEVSKDFAVYGSAERVADRIEELREVIGFTKLAVWMNVGSRVPHERVLASMRRFSELVIPRLK